jgi:hypothetical protein
MELKTARLTLLIDPHKKLAFERLCATQDRTASQVVRQLIRDYMAHHGVAYEASGAADDVVLSARTATQPPAQPAAKRRARHARG